MLLDGEQFNDQLTNYERSAWRFETQPMYAMPNEQPTLASFLAGEPRPQGYNRDWHDLVTGLLASGRTIGRVRTIRQPLTDYQRYQLAWGIPGNVEAGEDIRILDITGDSLDLPAHDFWLFDESTVVILNFYPEGSLHSVEQLESPDLGYYLKARDTALAHAVPFHEWNARSER